MSENQYTFENEIYKNTYRHTTSHILAQAVKRLHPGAKLAIGPAIDDGFYYDLDVPEPFAQDALDAIEAEMRKIIKEKLPLERFELPRAEAVALMRERGEPYKIELIEDLPEDAVISFYKQGEFTDLCAGPHLDGTARVKANAVKLLSATGAYWRGDSNNKMLQRVYGTCFQTKAELDAHLERIEEAKKRDHNKIGRELEYFTTVDYIGQGLPILMPKGAKVMQILQRFVEDEEARRGYLLTKTPFMAKRELYKISGHWDHYRDGMFILGGQDDYDDETKEVLALRPMTCPFQFQVYLSKTRSYRDLPMRFNETSTLFRNEASGEMHGLIRVRQFTISEGHLACRPDQVEGEFRGCVELAGFMLKTLGLDNEIAYRFSKWDPADKEKYIGSADDWESVQSLMKTILDDIGLDYVEADGEAAFYGPKLDIQIKNVHGKEDTLITIQIDFQLAERFGMEYVDSDGTKKLPYIIHRTSIGCYERVLALLIEHYAGALPLWLSPVQVAVLPITERAHAYAQGVADRLDGAGFRVETDTRNEKIGYKIREAQMQKIPYMLVLGDKEAESGALSVRSRSAGDLGETALEDFIAKITLECKERL
ncbi:MAG: threonine--tRNA ligase [Oscillospiraceae bacterium]|jgi:threonyl-tRNA synthetase|nr:threonine--tRNA ligase [Oscillospiraceae bacterium]